MFGLDDDGSPDFFKALTDLFALKSSGATDRRPQPAKPSAESATLSEAARDVLGAIRSFKAINETIPVFTMDKIMHHMGISDAEKRAIGRIGVATARTELTDNPMAFLFTPLLDSLEKALREP